MEKTVSYWHHFTRACNIPFEWQEAVIRASITLKMCSYEEVSKQLETAAVPQLLLQSGAILAAMTTSIPEAANSGRNWDYRFCWLRDRYAVSILTGRRLMAELTHQFLYRAGSKPSRGNGEYETLSSVHPHEPPRKANTTVTGFSSILSPVQRGKSFSRCTGYWCVRVRPVPTSRLIAHCHLCTDAN